MNFRLIQQALVALEMYRECTPEGNGVAEQAIVALKQFKKEWEETEVPYVVVECNCSGKTTLLSPSQPEQKPVAWMNDEGDVVTDQKWAKDQHYATPLYTTPLQRKPLTRDQRENVFAEADKLMDADDNLSWRIAILKATEAAHGIKE